jgi:heparan-alpha-glucosaminide N-acetyltransferase
VSATAATSSTGIAGQTTSLRVVSIDIFRGLTMAVMIFVNDLDSVHGLSKWTYHMPRNVDAMSYVDMVFPAFLFIVGMAIPIAVRQRLKRNPSVTLLWVHVVLRSLALLVLGLILANAEHVDRARTHLSGGAWALLGLAGGILLWNVYSGTSPTLARVLRLTGGVLLILVFTLFRRATPQGEAWLDFSYPEILGLIGLTYFSACLLYIPTRGRRLAPLVWLVILVAFNAACIADWVPMGHWNMYAWPFSNGCHVSLVMAGIVASTLFVDNPRWTMPSQKILLGVGFALAAFATGWFLRPFGISKIRATPTWALWTIAACLLLLAALYWLCDVRKRTAWAWLIRPAGSNTLLTYLIPDLWYFTAGLLSLAYIDQHWNHGWPGVTRAFIFTVAVLLVSHLATRARLRLQL